MLARHLLDEALVSGGSQRGADPLRLLGIGVRTEPDAISLFLVFRLRLADLQLAPAEFAAVLRRETHRERERLAARMERGDLQMEVLRRCRCFSDAGERQVVSRRPAQVEQ